jgi:hypothetical protein
MRTSSWSELEGTHPAMLSLTRIPKLLSLKWTDHRPLLA